MTPAYFRERLRYEPETGKLFWRPYAPHPACWNARYAGSEAFTALDGCGYRHGSLDGQWLLAHRVIWAMVHDVWPVEVDHEDHDRANNRIGNLKEVAHVFNQRNQKRNRNNSSGAAGVHLNKTGRWVAQIKVNGRARHLGVFASFDTAVAVRRAAEAARGYHKNHGEAS